MSTGATIALVGAGGVVLFLLLRSTHQTQAQAQAFTATAPVGAGGGGGGIGGLATRVFAQWKQDPLGIQNTKSAISTGVDVVKAGASGVKSIGSSIIGGIGSLF